MSVDKLQGLRCKVATVDEWLSSADAREDVIGAIEQGASKGWGSFSSIYIFLVGFIGHSLPDVRIGFQPHIGISNLFNGIPCFLSVVEHSA